LWSPHIVLSACLSPALRLNSSTAAKIVSYGAGQDVSLESTSGISSTRALSVLLSQVLVAFTVEFDNEFERRMGEAGYPGARLSLAVWANLMRFVGEGVSMRDLATQALSSGDEVKFETGCLERWGFVVLGPGPSDDRPVPSATHRQSGRERRAGWGSGRGIRMDWMVRLTSMGLAASRIWPPFDEIERRWEKRFGKSEISRLRQTLQRVADKLDIELPHGLPGAGALEAAVEYPPRTKHGKETLPLPTLLSRLLLMFRLEFDRESPAPLILCANTLRVLGEQPIRTSEIPRLTGGSPETSDIGWQIKPYVVVTPDPTAKRGKVVRLSPRGLLVQREYHRLTGEIEKRWEQRFGKEPIATLRQSLQGLFDRRIGDTPLLAQGLIPPPGTVRGGDQAPALGRRNVGTAARQRIRDLVAQTEAFVRDPAGSLPHYPSWDMNRGFGP
jgi:hypothetical protein